MRFTLAACVALVLAGCQGGAGVPWGTEPLVEPVTFGNTPITSARAHDVESIVGYKQGQSGSITVETYSRVAVQRAGDCLNLRTEVKSVETKTANLLEPYDRIYRMQFAARAGRKVDYVADMVAPSVSASLEPRGGVPQKSSDPTLIFSILLEQFHLGGETVTQGQEVMHYRLGDLLPQLRGEDAARSYSLRIAGRSTHEGRPVVVARAEGYVWVEDDPLSIDATHYFDIETGVALYTNAELRHLSGDAANTRIRFVRNLDLQQQVSKAWGGGTVPQAQALAWGECVNEI